MMSVSMRLRHCLLREQTLMGCDHLGSKELGQPRPKYYLELTDLTMDTIPYSSPCIKMEAPRGRNNFLSISRHQSLPQPFS